MTGHHQDQSGLREWKKNVPEKGELKKKKKKLKRPYVKEMSGISNQHPHKKLGQRLGKKKKGGRDDGGSSNFPYGGHERFQQKQKGGADTGKINRRWTLKQR